MFLLKHYDDNAMRQMIATIQRMIQKAKTIASYEIPCHESCLENTSLLDVLDQDHSEIDDMWKEAEKSSIISSS